MSVFVDIAPDESQPDSPAAATPSGKWRGRLTRAALPVLSLIVFFIVWQIARGSGHLESDVRAVPEHGVALVRRRLDDTRRRPRIRGLPAVGAPLHDAAPRPRRRRDRRGARCAARPCHGFGQLGAQRARTMADVPARVAAAGLLLPAGHLARYRRGAEDHAARIGGAAAGRRRDHRRGRRGTGRPAGSRPRTRRVPRRRSSATSWSRPRCPRHSPGSVLRWAWRTHRWSPPSCSTASPASAAWSRTPATTTTPRSCWSASSPSASPA